MKGLTCIGCIAQLKKMILRATAALQYQSDWCCKYMFVFDCHCVGNIFIFRLAYNETACLYRSLHSNHDFFDPKFHLEFVALKRKQTMFCDTPGVWVILVVGTLGQNQVHGSCLGNRINCRDAHLQNLIMGIWSPSWRSPWWRELASQCHGNPVLFSPHDARLLPWSIVLPDIISYFFLHLIYDITKSIFIGFDFLDQCGSIPDTNLQDAGFLISYIFQFYKHVFLSKSITLHFWNYLQPPLFIMCLYQDYYCTKKDLINTN